jgi:hypothetical protein
MELWMGNRRKSAVNTKRKSKASKHYRSGYRFPEYDRWEIEVDEFRLDTPIELENGTIVMRPTCTITQDAHTCRVVKATIGY